MINEEGRVTCPRDLIQLPSSNVVGGAGLTNPWRQQFKLKDIVILIRPKFNEETKSLGGDWSNWTRLTVHWRMRSSLPKPFLRCHLKLCCKVRCESPRPLCSLNTHLSGKVVYSDALNWDRYWIQTLFDGAGLTNPWRQQFKLNDIEILVRPEFREELRQQLAELDPPHRALPDAKLIAQAFSSLTPEARL